MRSKRYFNVSITRKAALPSYSLAARTSTVSGADFNRERRTVRIRNDAPFASLYLFSTVHPSAFASDAGGFDALTVYRAYTWRYLPTLLFEALCPQYLPDFFNGSVFLPFGIIVINLLPFGKS
jgi:hypothetical protein